MKIFGYLRLDIESGANSKNIYLSRVTTYI